MDADSTEPGQMKEDEGDLSAAVDTRKLIVDDDEWFKSGRTFVVSFFTGSGRPSTGTTSYNVKRLRVTVEPDRRLTVRKR